jgi:hypothetical protein
MAMIIIFGPVAQAVHGGHSSRAFDLGVGISVLALTWVGYSRRSTPKRINLWVAIAITAICGVFIYSGLRP